MSTIIIPFDRFPARKQPAFKPRTQHPAMPGAPSTATPTWPTKHFPHSSSLQPPSHGNATNPTEQRTAGTCPKPQRIRAEQAPMTNREKTQVAGPQMVAPQRSTPPARPEGLPSENPAQIGRGRPGGGRAVAREKGGLHPGPGAATHLPKAQVRFDNTKTVPVLRDSAGRMKGHQGALGSLD